MIPAQSEIERLMRQVSTLRLWLEVIEEAAKEAKVPHETIARMASQALTGRRTEP
jgi:hypothetical protein